MTSEGLGEMFEGDSADMCAGKFPLVSMGAEQRVSRAQTRELGPPSALAEILSVMVCLAWLIRSDLSHKSLNENYSSGHNKVKVSSDYALI